MSREIDSFIQNKCHSQINAKYGVTLQKVLNY